MNQPAGAMQFEVRLFLFGQFDLINEVVIDGKVPKNEYPMSITMRKR